LLAEWDSAHDHLSFLLESVRDRGFTQAESIQLTRLVRRVAIVSSALHGRGVRALIGVERL
jgi:hypothetical protein